MDCFDILSLIQPDHIVCEIGCRMGVSTKLMLEAGAKVYTIDPWENYMEYREQVSKEWFHEALRTLAPFGDQVVILRMMSEEAAPFIPECDLVWVDGNHSFAYVARDMELYWPKIKEGGYLTGDDYHEDKHPGVKDAVNYFVEKTKLTLDIIGRSWIIKKGENSIEMI